MTTWQAVQTAMATLRSMPERVQALRDKCREDTKTIRVNPNYSERYATQQVERTRRDAADALQSLYATAETANRTVDSYTPTPLGATDPLVAEQRLARGWSRADRMLGNGMGVREVLTFAVDAHDLDMLLALREQGPAFVAASPGLSAADRQIDANAFRVRIAEAIARAYPDTDEGRWIAAHTVAGLLFQRIVHEVKHADAMIKGGPLDSLGHALSVRYLEDEISNLEARLAPAAPAPRSV